MDREMVGILLALISGAASIIFGCLKIQQKLSREMEYVTRNQSRVDRIMDSTDFETIRTELVQVVSENIRESPEKIKLISDFRHDLRVPPGEMHILFDEVDESFQIELERSQIHTFKDLFQQVCDRRIC